MPYCKRSQHSERWAWFDKPDQFLLLSWGILSHIWEANSSEIALLTHASWRVCSLYCTLVQIQFSWRISAHSSVKPHGAVSIGKPFPCFTKLCHFSVVPAHSHSPVSRLSEWFSRKGQTCDKLNPRQLVHLWGIPEDCVSGFPCLCCSAGTAVWSYHEFLSVIPLGIVPCTTLHLENLFAGHTGNPLQKPVSQAWEPGAYRENNWKGSQPWAWLRELCHSVIYFCGFFLIQQELCLYCAGPSVYVQLMEK